MATMLHFDYTWKAEALLNGNKEIPAHPWSITMLDTVSVEFQDKNLIESSEVGVNKSQNQIESNLNYWCQKLKGWYQNFCVKRPINPILSLLVSKMTQTLQRETQLRTIRLCLLCLASLKEGWGTSTSVCPGACCLVFWNPKGYNFRIVAFADHLHAHNTCL